MEPQCLEGKGPRMRIAHYYTPLFISVLFGYSRARSIDIMNPHSHKVETPDENTKATPWQSVGGATDWSEHIEATPWGREVREPQPNKDLRVNPWAPDQYVKVIVLSDTNVSAEESNMEATPWGSHHSVRSS